MQIYQQFDFEMITYLPSPPSHYFSAENLLSAPVLVGHQVGEQLGNSLILAPHPDDEALGCGGVVQFLLEQEATVKIFFMTSGGASHPNSKLFPAPKLAALREKEALKACGILGIPASDVQFLRFPDSLLGDSTLEEKDEIADQIAEALSKFEISSLFLPWRRDPHPDHRATFELGKMAASRIKVQVIEYPIWLWKNSKEEDWPKYGEVEVFRLDVSEMMPKKIQAIFAHKSQTSNLIKDDPQGFQLTEDLLSPFFHPFEFFFISADQNKDSLQKHYFEHLYSSNPDPWNFIESVYEKSKYQKIDSFLGRRKFENALEIGCSIGVHTKLLAAHCEKLLAVDISERAIAIAKQANSDLPNVVFHILDILKDFPHGPFDFIAMCEVGYYFNKEALLSLFNKISENLSKTGMFLMVHWTSFVQDNPLSGRQVNQIFSKFNSEGNQFKKVSSYRHDSYELVLWEKV